MKNAVAWFVVVSWLLPLPLLVAAEENKEVSAAGKTATSSLLVALQLRESLTAAIVAGDEKPEAALGRLQEHPAPTGLALRRDTEYALAVVEIGQRLLAADRPTEAEAFFREGERALGAALRNLRREDSHERLMVLRKRAQVRGRYLGMGREAQADFEEAIALKPDDKAIARQRDLLLSVYPDLNRAPVQQQN